LLKIRLSRAGKKSQPSFRVVVQEHTASPKGKSIEIIGTYAPSANPKILKIDLDRAKHWVSVGAQPSDTVAVLLKRQGMTGMEKFIAPRDKKKKSKKGGDAAAESPAPVAAEAEAPAA